MQNSSGKMRPGGFGAGPEAGLYFAFSTLR